MQKLEEIKIPDGFERELIIIGDHAYSVVEKVQTFLGKKVVTKEISRVGAIPEGVFFAEGYSPRILSENGKKLAIEILKRTGAKKRKPLPKDDGKDDNNTLKAPLKDLLKSNECYIVVSYENRKVYLWKGKNCNVRSRFIGVKKSQDIRGRLGNDFKIVVLDEGNEDSDFLKLIGGKITMKKSEDYDDDDDVYFPYPYIFKPPEPPDDFAMAPQVLIRAPLKEKEPEGENNCQYCGIKLTEEERFTHSCKEKPKNK